VIRIEAPIELLVVAGLTAPLALGAELLAHGRDLLAHAR
jgi:hypothetical protein